MQRDYCQYGSSSCLLGLPGERVMGRCSAGGEGKMRAGKENIVVDGEGT